MVKYLALADCCIDSNFHPQGEEFWRDTKLEETPSYLEIVAEEGATAKKSRAKTADDEL